MPQPIAPRWSSRPLSVGRRTRQSDQDDRRLIDALTLPPSDSAGEFASDSCASLNGQFGGSRVRPGRRRSTQNVEHQRGQLCRLEGFRAVAQGDAGERLCQRRGHCSDNEIRIYALTGEGVAVWAQRAASECMSATAEITSDGDWPIIEAPATSRARDSIAHEEEKALLSGRTP